MRQTIPPKKKSYIFCVAVSSSLVKALLSYAYICMRLDNQISWYKIESQYIGVYRKCGVANYTWSEIGPTNHIKIYKNESLPQWIEPHAINCHMITCWHVPSNYAIRREKQGMLVLAGGWCHERPHLVEKKGGVTKYGQELHLHP